MVPRDRSRGWGTILTVSLLTVFLVLVSNRVPLGPWSHLMPGEKHGAPSKRSLPTPILVIAVEVAEEEATKSSLRPSLEPKLAGGLAPASSLETESHLIAGMATPTYLQSFRGLGPRCQLSPPA